MEASDSEEEESTHEDIRFDLSRPRDVEFFSENCSPDSEEEKLACDFPLPRGSFWSGSLTLSEKSPSVDVWVMVASNSFSSSLWYMNGEISRIRIEWTDDDIVHLTDENEIELYGIFDLEFPMDVMGVGRKRGESTVGDFFLKKRDLSRNVHISLGGSWIPAHILEEQEDSIECVVTFSKKAVQDDVLSLTLTVREDRIRRGRSVDHCILTSVDNVLLTILEFSVETGEELQLLSYLSNRIQSLLTHSKCNLLWKSLSLARWKLLSSDVEADDWRLFYLSRQQFDYAKTKNSQRDYVIDIHGCGHKHPSETIELLNSGKIRFKFRCPFSWDNMKKEKTNNGLVARKCRNCEKTVSYTPDIEEAHELLQKGNTVALPLVVTDGLAHGPQEDVAYFPDIPSKHRIQLKSALPQHLQDLGIKGLQRTFEKMESRKSYADLVGVLDFGPRRLDIMDVDSFKVEMT